MKSAHRIAVIPGDGIGKEVMPVALRVLEAVQRRFGLQLDCTPMDWASCEHWQQHGQMMPDDWKQQLSGMDAILFGAVGWPAIVPDHVSLWGSLLKFRREFDQYINLRPVRLFAGVPCPLAGKQPGDIDFVVVRENTEGEYTNLGGVMYAGTEREIVVQETVMSRFGADRVLRYAFKLAAARPRRQHHRNDQHIRRDRKERAFDKDHHEQRRQRERARGQAHRPVIELAQHRGLGL